MTKKQAAAARREHLDAARAAGSEIIRPANYAHLVEFGTKHAAAHPFMRPAIVQSRSKVLRIISQEIQKALKNL